MSTRKPARLHSGAEGNGMPRGTRKGSGKSRPRAYRVIATSAGQWSTSVSHNSTRIWREER